MLQVRNNAIYLTRGDTAKLSLTITDEEGKPYVIQDTDTVLFTIKRTTSDKDVVLQKRAVDSTIYITAAETEPLAYGTYKYDVELRKDDGTVSTVIVPSPFVLCEEVTF